MRTLLALAGLGACAAPATPPPAQPAASTDPASPAAPAVAAPRAALSPWTIPDGFRSETIPFPLEFAPSVAHRGAEELRFAPGFFDPAAPGYWSYAFVWRTEDAAALDPPGVAAELTAYFRGLIAAVDEAGKITARDQIAVRAAPAGARVALTAHVFDAFKTQRPLDLVGWAERTACGTGALWRFVLAPSASPLRPALDALAAQAACDQPLPPPAK